MGREVNQNNLAASFQQAVMDVIVTKSLEAAEEYGRGRIALAGGVASNSLLRSMMEEACRKKGFQYCRPDPVLCTDNAAMIACAAYYMSEEGLISDLSLDAYPVLDLDWCRHMN